MYVDDGQNHEFKQGKFIYDKLSFSSQELISEPGQRLHAVGPASGAEAQRESYESYLSGFGGQTAVERVVFVGPDPLKHSF